MTRKLTGLRLSELARCPRMCALRGLGHEPAEPSPRGRRYQTRGQMFGYYAFQQFRERYPDAQREVEITWPLGTGHADIYLPSEKLLIEVVSSTSPNEIFPAKMKQVRCYLLYHPEANSAAVYVINPSDLDREALLPVILRPEDVTEIAADVAMVEAALDGGPLPPCSAATPSDCEHSLFCPFAGVAWEGWEPPPLPEANSVDAVLLASRYYRAKRAEGEARGGTSEAERERKELEAELAAVFPLGKTASGPFVVSRTQVNRKGTFNLDAARAAGVSDEDLLGPFIKPGANYETWRIEREKDAPLPAADFGEVPF